jgi:hypothetical protein
MYSPFLAYEKVETTSPTQQPFAITSHTRDVTSKSLRPAIAVQWPGDLTYLSLHNP